MSNKRRAKPQRQLATRSSNRRNTWLLAGIAAAVVGLVLAIALVSGSGDTDTEATEIADVETSGEALPEFDAAGADPAVGQALPTIRGVDFDGRSVSVGGDGAATLVFVVAHWCPHCQRDLPIVADVLKDADLEGVSVVALSSLASAERPNWPPSAWFDDEGWPASVVVDDADNTAYRVLGASGTPFTVVAGKDGTVLRRVSGELGADGVRSLIELARSS